MTRQGAELTMQGAELTRQGAELMRAEETIRREQQQNQERVGLVCVVLCVVTRGPPDCRRLS